MTQGLLRIYVEDKDGNIVSFPLNEEQAIVEDWTRTAERMAGAPSVTGTVMHKLCLDNLWTKKEFVVIGGERYYVKQVPTSSKDTEDVRYKHDVTLVSERDILENVYFFDVVTKREDAQASDKPRSNTTVFSFFGDLKELVERLNDSLAYSKIYDAEGVNGFCIVIDEDVEIGEAQEVSITDAYFATAMQEIYNVFKVPYYWVGKVCHVGYAQNEITTPFEYGKDNGLLSVSKNNSEYRLINRITGMGSADNIPYYYPNTDTNGIAEFDTYNISNPEGVKVLTSILTSKVGSDYLRKDIVLSKNPSSKEFNISSSDASGFNGSISIISGNGPTYASDYIVQIFCYLPKGVVVDLSTLNGSAYSTNTEYAKILDSGSGIKKRCAYYETYENLSNYAYEEVPINKEIDREGYWQFQLWIPWKIQSILKTTVGWVYAPSYLGIKREGSFIIKYNNEEIYSLSVGEKIIPYNNSGITIPNIESQPCDKSDITLSKDSKDIYRFGIKVTEKTENPARIVINNVKRIPTMTNLMPSVYRDTEGMERFYNAVNGKYKDEEGNFYSFNNPYLPNEPLEGKQDFEDIKPTINGITNAQGQLFGEVADIAFDETDSDDLAIKDGESNTANLVHSYFYIKLHKFDGDYGFNLFKQGLSKGAMTLNFISGSCAGCAFEVGVSKPSQVDNHYEFENPIQVDESGNIVAGDYDDKVKEGNPIESQQDTTTNEVWIALKKDQSTFGVVMPNATNNYRPQGKTELREGDKFVITNILLPTQYITAAEKRLEASLIKYMSENNDEKFTFSIKFSRIYLQKHIEDIVPYLNENARINVKYNNTIYPLYVSSYTQKYDGNILDEISVELSEELTITQNKSKQQMDSILGNVNEQINSALKDNNNPQQGVTDSDLVAIKNLLNNKLSKVTSDTAAGIITFLQGTNWGNFTSETGAAMTVDPTTGQTYMEVDRLKVRLKAFFEQLEVQKVGYVGGKIVVSKGQGVDILDVEEVFDSEGNLSAYRCYFLGEQEGRRIDNLLRVDDQMICKDENISEGSTDGATNKYYWRLATAVSSDVVKRGNNVCHWVDLSATDCDTNSDIPEIGDTICHLGNREDTDRQGAEVLSVVDANSPSFTIYSGINSYSLVNKEYIDMGVINGKAYCNIYGSTYIGDRERSTGYLRWNDDTKTFEIKGIIDISSPLSSGGTIGGAINNAANAYKDDFSAFTSNVNEIIGGFQAQIDGVIETWFYDPEPTLGNLPASEWKDNTTKDKHLGDLYYSKDGLAYRFQKEGDIYKWVQIDDTAITSALKEAKAAKDAAAAAQGTADTAQTTANSKMKVFVVQPTNNDEYSIGDMWVNATYPADGSTYNNEILHCVTAKAAGGAFSISHWAQSSNIKTQFNNFVNNTYAEDKADFYNQLDGKVETWYQSADPKDKWNKADYSKHKGDIWYNDSTNKSYRWTGTAWVELKDQAAIDAKALAESKRRVFTTTTLPTPPYDAKDLWVQGENGDIMVCVTPKAAGATASASDWVKASKYTDDTAAKAAQKTANDAAAAAKNIDDAILAIDNNVDVALKDKIITKTEAAAISEALNSLSAIMTDVTKTYAELVNNDVYKLIASDVRTSYKNAYDKLVATFNALSDYITNTLTKANPITSEILSTYNTHYTNFKTDYEAYVSKLNVVRNSMDALLNTQIGDIATMLGGLKATTDAMDETTQINGGLILSTLLALGYTEGNNFNVMSGVSGLYESDTEKGGGIAFWAGGHRIDINDCTKNADGTYSMGGKVVNPADFLVRHDGTGYAAGGALWWEKDGKVHADPQSFLINEQYVGNVMQLFKFVYSGGTAFENIVHAIPQKPFESLSVGANGLTLYNGKNTAKLYIKNGVLFIEGDLAVTGGITMYASDGVKSGMIDQVYAVLDQSLFSIVDGAITITGEIGGGTVKGIAIKGTQYDPDNNGIIALTLNWGDLTGVPTEFTPSAHTHTFASLTSKPTTLSGYGITDAKIANGVITLGTATITPLTTHQTVTLASGTNNGTLKLTVGSTTTDNIAVKGLGSAAYTASSAYAAASHTHSQYLVASSLDGYVNALTDNTSTNVFVTAISKSGKTLSYTKSFTKKSLTAASHSGWSSADTDKLIIPDMSFIAYWNGAYNSSGGSNLAYCNKGAFGDMATASKSSYYTKSDTYSKTEVNTKLTDGSVTKLGTATVGSGTQHFYLDAGTATASTSTVGGTAKPIFLNAGTLTAISATVGSASKPVYLNGGSVTACSYDFTSYLPLSGGTMGGTAWIVWPSSSNWDNGNSGVTFPVTRGGLQWEGQSDWVKLYSQETGSDNLNLVLQFGDDNSNGLSIRNASGSQTAFIAATGHITAANTTVNGTLKVGAIPVTNSSTGILKIDGNLIVTGGITMYATDGVASGLMEQILVDGTTIKKKADGTLYVDPAYVGGGTVKGATVGGTAVTLDSATGILQFPAYPTLSSLGAAAASHTHAYLPLSGGTMSGYISAPNKGIIFYGSVGATTGAYITGSSEGVYINGYKYVTLESSSVNYHPRVRLNTVDYPLLSTYNYNSYVPTLTGTGASGTWGISISGNAAMATNADTVDGWHASSFSIRRTGVYSQYARILQFRRSGEKGWLRISIYDSHNGGNGIGGCYIIYWGWTNATTKTLALNCLYARGDVGRNLIAVHDSDDSSYSYYSLYWLGTSEARYSSLTVEDYTSSCEITSYTEIGVDSVPTATYTSDYSTLYGCMSTATTATNSDTCDGLHVHGGRNNEANKIVRTDGSGYLQCGYINSSSGNEGNNSSPARVWGTNGSDNYMRTYLTSALNVYTSGSVRSESGNKTTGLQYYSASGGFTKDGTGVSGAWSVPSDSVDAQYGNGQAIRMWWDSKYYTDILSGPNVWGATKGLYIRQIVAGAISAGTFTGGWRLLLDSSNYNRYVPTLTGGGASGTWGISISGNAATATNADTLDGNHASAFAFQGADNNLINHGNEFTFVPDSFSGSIYFNYRTKGGTNGNITDYVFGNGKGGTLGTAIHTGNYNSYAPTLTGAGASGTWGISISGNAATATAVKDVSNSRTTYLNYGESGISSPSWLCAWNVRSDSTYEVRAISPDNMLSVIKALPLAGGTMNANARISHADGNMYLGRADNNGYVYVQDIASQSGIDKWYIKQSGDAIFKNINASGSITMSGHLWLNAQNASSSTSGASQLIFGNNGTQHVVITSNTGAIIVNPSTSSYTGQVIIRVGASSTSEFAGNIKAGGGITMYSDLRKKNILSDEVLSVKEIAAAPLFKHTYKSDDNQYIHVGTSAQYWSGIHEDWFTRKDSEGYYQMELQNLGVAMGISLAREVIKYESKTDKKIRLMKKKINDLEARIKELEERRTA